MFQEMDRQPPTHPTLHTISGDCCFFCFSFSPLILQRGESGHLLLPMATNKALGNGEKKVEIENRMCAHCQQVSHKLQCRREPEIQVSRLWLLVWHWTRQQQVGYLCRVVRVTYLFSSVTLMWTNQDTKLPNTISNPVRSGRKKRCFRSTLSALPDW